jgi:hypothetical protein
VQASWCAALCPCCSCASRVRVYAASSCAFRRTHISSLVF